MDLKCNLHRHDCHFHSGDGVHLPCVRLTVGQNDVRVVHHAKLRDLVSLMRRLLRAILLSLDADRLSRMDDIIRSFPFFLLLDNHLLAIRLQILDHIHRSAQVS